MWQTILVFCCYENAFFEANYQQRSSMRRFSFSWNENHEVFVLACKSHVFIADIDESKPCKCKYVAIILPVFYVAVKEAINLSVYK